MRLNCWQRLAKRTDCVFFLLLILSMSFAQAATYTVTNLNDIGAGSLRQAILDANANTGSSNTIEFQAGVTGTLLTQGNLNITGGTLTIQGPGASVLTLFGNGANRIFDISSGATVTLSGLTLSNGKPAIVNLGNLIVNNSTLSANFNVSISSGGGILNNTSGTLTINNSILTNNVSSASGGAIANNASSSMLTVNNSTLSGNSAANDGGGIYNGGGTVTVTNSTLSNNSVTGTGSYGGGIYSNTGTLTVTYTTLSGNSVIQQRGGGIYFGGSSGNVTLHHNTLSGNTGGTNSDAGGIGIVGTSTGNITVNPIYNNTLSGNTGRDGGGLYISYVTVPLFNNTIAGNTATRNGGGIAIGTGGILNMGNNIVAGNSAATGRSIYGTGGLVSQGHNLFGENNSAELAGGITGSAGDLTLAGALSTAIDPLASNGGPTQTRFPVTGSPAINAGDNALVPSGVTDDQRGVTRIQEGIVDIGAVETGSATVSHTVTATGGLNGSITPPSATVSDGDTTQFIVNPDIGYVANVTGCNGSLSGNTYTTGAITADCTVNATFSPQTFTVTATAGANGGISPSSRTVAYNNSTSFTVTPNTGYAIDTVTGCNGILSGNIYNTGAITADCAVNATFVQKSYTVSATAGANGSITPTSQTVTHGTTTTFTVTPNTGYTATVTGCGGALSGNTYTTGIVTADCTVSATFSQQSWTVSATAGANGSISPASQSVIQGETATLTVTPNSSYAAVVTGCNGSLSGNTYTTGPITADCTVSATFTQQTYTVSTTAGSNGSISPVSRTVAEGATTTFTVTPNTGYTATVTGCGGSLSGTTYTTDVITSACTVNATFTAQTYTVSATAGSNGSISPTSQTVAHGATTTFTVTPNSGYTATVTGCGGILSGNTYTTGVIMGACTVDATFTQQTTTTFTVTATAGANGSISPVSQTVTQGATTTFTVTPNTGYTATITGCNGSLSGNTYTTGAITSACAISASFTQQTYPVTALAGTNGAIVPSTQTVAYGATATLTLLPSAGYTAVATGCGGVQSGNTYFTGPVTSACTVSASFTQQTYVVTATAGAHGAISPLTQTVAHGATTTFTLAPEAGYSPVVLSTCGGAQSGNTFTTGPVTSACAITASFTQQTYAVTATAGLHGAITPATQTVAHGATATLVALPDTGYTAAITGCGGVQTGNSYTTEPITEACAVSATFTQQTYTLTATASGNGRITPATQTVARGATTTLSVIPDSGYAALITSTCGGTLTDNTFTTGSITANCTINANFIRNTQTHTVIVTASPNGSVSPFTQAVRHSYPASIVITPDPDYAAAVASTCGGALTDNVYTTAPVTADCEMTVTFNLSTGGAYTVMAQLVSNSEIRGDISPASQVISYGQTARFNIFPDLGYWASVSGCDGALTGGVYITGPVTTDCTVRASFSPSPTRTMPALTLPAPPGATTGLPYGAVLAASGGDPPYLYSATGLPAGLQLDPNGVLIGTPTESGSFNARLTVTDALGHTSEREYAFTVTDHLALATTRLAEGLVNTAYYQALHSVGGRPPYRYRADGLPAGLTLTPEGILSGTPQTAGDTSVLITVNDAIGESDTQTLALTVRDATLTRPNPTQPDQTISAAITPPSGETCDVASTETYTLNLGDPGAPTEAPEGVELPYGLLRIVVRGCTAGQTVLAFTTVYPEPLPPGAQYWKYGRTPDDPTPHWYVMPGAIVEGNSVTFLITDGGIGDDDLKVDANITDPGGPGLPNLAIQGDIPARSSLSRPYRATLQARYGSRRGTATATVAPQAESATTYLWSVVDGALPPGLTLESANGEAVLSGEPTRAGVYAFTMQAIDKNRENTLAQQTYQIEVTGGDPATTLILHYYSAILGREPEPEGLAFWQWLITTAQEQRSDIKPVFREMANFFYNSPEYLEKNANNLEFLFNLYYTFFQREPDDGGLVFWLAQLVAGIPRDEVMAGFLYSPEFTDFMTGLGL
ncbi:MAG: DUF4214 domain-containing protein [Candidatus Competibacteraceae bacterium]|nr:DUF4214 domain-containing protein [Candidatus Competibacteraceae bacterium]